MRDSAQPTPDAGADSAMHGAQRGADTRGMFQVLLRHSFDGVVLNSGHSRIFVEVSDSFCAMTGYTREELIGHTSDELGLMDPDGAHTELARQADGQGRLFETRLRHKDGSDTWIEFSTQILDDDLVLSIVRDITGRRAIEDLLLKENQAAVDARRDAEVSRAEAEQARSEADHANRAKSEFLSRMSHELRTPLNAVLGFAQLLALDDLTPAQRDAVDRILRGGTHLVGLIAELLDISRIETGDLALSPEVVNAGEIVEAAIELVRPMTADNSAQISVDLTALGKLELLADRQRLKQIVLNLLSNAIKYNKINGSVTISAALVGARLAQIRVTDTGNGMDPEHLKRLFTPFDRLGADGTQIEGTGIGLSLSRRLAEAMGGSIGVRSTVGFGSTFWVEVPVAIKQPELLGHIQRNAEHDNAKHNNAEHGNAKHDNAQHDPTSTATGAHS